MRVLMLVAVMVLSGCATEGAECSGGATCDGPNASFWCEGETTGSPGRLHRYACPGALGCASNNGQTLCDFRGSTEGTGCPAAAKGSGFCSSSTRFVSCSGAIWQGKDCSSCVTNGLVATCNP